MRFPILAVAVLSISASAVPLQADEDLRIVKPAANETVSGIVEIRGSAAAPGMLRFRVEFGYDPDPTGTWFLILEETKPVQDGKLADWDTNPVSDGIYALRLAAYFADGSMQETVARGLHIRRGNPPAAASPVEAVTPIAPDPSAYIRAAAAFPAPTAVFSTGPAAAGTFPLHGIEILAGAGLALAGFGLLWIRSRWLWWKRRLFIRKLRKDGS
jgi:hypothetical protein